MKKIITLLYVLMITGCAGIISGGDDTVTISSGSIEDSKIYLNGMHVGKDNVRTELKRGENYAIRVEKEGCSTAYHTTADRFDFWTLGGIFWDFGIFTVTTDLITGNAWKADQKQYLVTPNCNS